MKDVTKGDMSLPSSKIKKKKHSHPCLQLPHTSYKVNNTEESADGADNGFFSLLIVQNEREILTSNFFPWLLAHAAKNISDKTQKEKKLFFAVFNNVKPSLETRTQIHKQT